MDGNYEIEYKNFVTSLEQGIPVSGEDVGKLIVRMAQYFSEAVKEAAATEFSYNKKLLDFEKQSDENGKPLSSTKAENYAKATPEYYAYTLAKGNVNVIEQQINGLKALQKGLSNEYSHLSN